MATWADEVLTCIGSGVLAVDHDAMVRVYNPAAANILGVSSRCVLGRSLASLEHDGEPLRRVAFTLRTEGLEGRRPPLCRRIDVVTSAGSRSLSYNACVMGSSLAAVMVFTDVTQVVEIECRAAEDFALAGVGREAITVAHDLKSPLAAIRLHADLAANGGDSVPDHLRAISWAAGDCFSLLAEIRQETGGDATAQLCDANDVLRRFVDEHQDDPDVPLADVIAREPASVMLSEGQLTSILANLVRNAIESGPPGNLVELHSTSAHGWLVFRILDSGSGLPDSDVFQLFFSTKGRGEGMGLWLTRRLVERAGGHIVGRQRASGGAEMVVSLPHTDHRRLRNRRFLVVDKGVDDPAGIVTALQHMGAEVVTATSNEDLADAGGEVEAYDCAVFGYRAPRFGDHHLALMAPLQTHVLSGGDERAMAAALTAMHRGSLRLMPEPCTAEGVLDAASVMISQSCRA